MHCAARFGHLAIVQCLLKEGQGNMEKYVDKTSGSECVTILHLVCMFGYLDIVQFLLVEREASAATVTFEMQIILLPVV